METSTISICIPVYNGEKYILDAVHSALSQNYSNLEVVVMNNCSTDQTFELISNIDDARLKIIQAREFVGMAANWDRSVDFVTGEYVLMLSADDCLMEGAITALSAPIFQNPSIDLVLGRPKHLDQSGRPFGAALRQMPSGPIEELEHFVIAHTPAININAVLFRKDLASFRSDAGLVCDLDLLLRLGREGKKAFVLNREVLAYREHEGALSTDRVRMWSETIDCYVHSLSKSSKPRIYSWRLFKTLYWFGSHVLGSDREHLFQEKLLISKKHLKMWHRLILKLGRIRVVTATAARIRNVASRFPTTG